jgi:hypothetical protein
MEDKDFINQIHILIHSVRSIPGYKSSEMDKKVSQLVIKKFSDTCEECRAVGEKIKTTPQQSTFIEKLGGLLTG